MKLFFFLPILALVMLNATGCSNLTSTTATAVPSPSGDVIATAVAGTLAAHAAKTATVAAQIQLTASAAVPTGTATPANTPEVTATEIASAPPTATTVPTQAAVPAYNPAPLKSLTVAFVGAGNNVWVWRNGQSTALTHSGDVSEVSLSDDGRWIAFTRSTASTSYSLWAIDVNGQNERALMNAQAFASLPRAPGAVAVMTFMFNWAPGSHTVAFSTRPIFEGPGMLLNDDLWLVNVDTLARQELLPAGKGGKFYFSRDGKQIALAKSTSISLINADGSNRRDSILTFPQVKTYSEYLFYPTPIWLPDNSAVRVVIPPEASLEHPEGNTVIWQVPADGSAAQILGIVNSAPLRFPQLSPDGSRLAYLKQVGEAAQNRTELHIANADGTDDSVYSTDPLTGLISWSPDAQHFFFTTGSTNQPWIGAPGAEPQSILGVSGAMEARWLDNAHFLFVTHNNGSIELRQGDLTGSSEVLTSFLGQEASPLLYDYSLGIP